LADGLVVINCDQKKNPYLLAVDQSTGEQVWKIKRPDSKGIWSWSTPVLWKHGDKTELVVLGRERLIAYDLKDGRERWWVKNLPVETASTPVYAGETLYMTATVPFHGDPVNLPQIPDPNEFFQEYDVNGDNWNTGILLCISGSGERQDILLFILRDSGRSTSRGPIQDIGTE